MALWKWSLLWVIGAAASVSTAQNAPGQNASEQTAPTPQLTTTRLDWLDVSHFEPDGGDAQRRKTVENHPIRVVGKEYPYAICMYAPAEIVFDLEKDATQFSASFGVDDESDRGEAIECKLLIDGKEVGDTGLLKFGDAPRELKAELTGASEMKIVITDPGGKAHADILNGSFTYFAGTFRPEIHRTLNDPDAMKVPPIASGDPPEPEIHGPRAAGATPGRPFLFLIPATGKGALTYAAENLPDGLNVDSKTGVISGAIREAGVYRVTIIATSELGKSTRELKIVAGQHTLAQTPPMGWNSWNAWGSEVTGARVRAAADGMVKSGLAAKGYQYINIDDAWEGKRDAKGIIQPNEKFGDMKALADYVHAKGLRFGIYSSPGPRTCGKYEGSYKHELDDARWYAKVGVDYLKYDWCSYASVAGSDRSLPAVQKPYRIMREALDQVDRDIVYSFCQYGMGDSWQWGAEVGGNLWRTTSDIADSWTLVGDIGFNQAAISRYGGVGHWNDPDMLVVGKLGWGAELRSSRLTPSEQVSHITLWSMLSAPLLTGCDLSDMDQFTIDLLGNPEMIDIDQDLLGRGGEPARIDGKIEIWKKSLFDGGAAIAVFNRGRLGQDVDVKWDQIGLAGSQHVRDVWQRKDLGDIPDQIRLHVPRHGAVLLKVSATK